MANRFCTNCGASMEEGKRFCTQCGTPLQEVPAAPADVQPQAPEEPFEPQVTPAAEPAAAAPQFQAPTPDALTESQANPFTAQPQQNQTYAPQNNTAAPGYGYTAPNNTQPNYGYTAPNNAQPGYGYTAPNNGQPGYSYTAPGTPYPANPYAAQNAYVPQNSNDDVLTKEDLRGTEFEPISAWGFVGINLLLSIPLVGLILTIVWACGGCRKFQKKKYAQSILLTALVIFGVLFLILLFLGVTIGEFIYELLPYYYY